MSNKHPYQNFDKLRNQLLNDIYIGIGIAAIPGLAISIWRSVIFGFQAFMLIQIVLVATIWIIWVWRIRIPYLVRAGCLLAILWVASFAALSQLGPVSDSKVFIILFAFTSILFLNSRTAWTLVGGMIMSVSLFGYAAVQHWFAFEIDFQTYAHHPISWIITTWNMSIFSSIVAYIGWRMMNNLRKQNETSKELAGRLQKISERVPGVVYQYKLNSDGSSCFPYASDRIYDVYHVTPAQVQSDASDVFKILHPQDYDGIVASIQESAQTLKPWQHDYRVQFPDGHIQWLSGNAIPQREPDGSVLWHGVITDITDRKNAERIKDEFVSTVSHELRTPLTAIMGSIKLINSGILEENPEKRKELLTVAERNSERLLFMINDLLDIEKLEKGSIKLNKMSINLQDFINECINENQSFASAHNTEIQLMECDNIEIEIDPQRMKQVIANLLSNACKYTRADKPVEVRVRQDKNKVKFSVTDYGEGIPEDFQPKVFDKFTQADSSSTRKVSGSGLGLSIAKKIVELHKGNINFVSSPNTGTTFSFEIPI